MMRSFKKTDTQKSAIHRIVNTAARNIMIYGGSRSGKSFIIVYILIVRAIKVPNSHHLIVRNTFSAVKTSIWNETIPKVLNLAFPDLKYKMNRSEFLVQFPNGSTIKVAGLDDKERVEKLLGTEYSSLFFNEANQISFLAIAKLKTRLAEKNELKKMCYYDQNPTTTSSALYQVFEQGINPVDGEAMDAEEIADHMSIRMNIEGNLENVDENYVKMLSKLPHKERLRFLAGEYDNDNSGSAVYAFNRDEHVTESAIRLDGSDWVGSDFNYEWNSDVLVSQHNDGINVWDENQIIGDTYKKCDALKRKGVYGASIVCDSTGKARSTKGKSDHLILKEAGFDVRYKTNPHVTDKIANLNRCFSLGLIKIHPQCKKLIRDLTQLTWDKDGKLDQKTDPSLSHLVDGLAYLVYYLYPLTDRSRKSKMYQL